jgi:hypothetical protein
LVSLVKKNDSTAVDKKGNGWFRQNTQEAHRYWIKCDVCGKTVRFYWSNWPEFDFKVCDTCVDWRNTNGKT